MRKFNVILVGLLFTVFFVFSVMAAVPPKGFPDKKLLTTDPKKFWTEFGKAATGSDPQLGIVDKGRKVVNAVDAYQSHYEFMANTGYTGRVRYLGGDERCEVWRDRMMYAFKGAGIPNDKRVYASSLATGLGSYNLFDVNRVHTAPALIGDDGKVYVFDVWQQGYDKSSMGVGSIKGVGQSRYNGMTMADWVKLQKKSGRTTIEVDDNPIGIFINGLVGDTSKLLTSLLKEKKCQRKISSRELSSKLNAYADRMIRNRWKYDPYFIIREMIRQGDIECLNVEINTSIVLLMDTSGSMKGGKIADAKRAAIAAIKSMPPDVEVGIMSYSGGCSGKFPFLPFTQDETVLSKAINSLSPGGGTPMSPSLRQAEKAILAFGRGLSGKIILLCDGQNDCAENPVKAADAIFRRNISVKKTSSIIPKGSKFWSVLNWEHMRVQLSTSSAWAGDPQYQGFIRINFHDPIFDELINGAQREKKPIKIDTVGFKVSKQEQAVLDKVAKAGGGRASSAQDIKGLTKAFTNAIKEPTKPDPKPELKPEPKPELKPEPKPTSEDGWQSLDQEDSPVSGRQGKDLERQRKPPKGHSTKYGF